jgi:hypothetical protein
MTPEDIHHLCAVGGIAGCTDYFGSFAEVCGAHYRRGYDGQLFHILAAEVIEAVHGASGMHNACPGPTSMGAPSTVQVRTPSIP